MRLHSNILTRTDINDAARVAGVTVPVLRDHGSRKRARAYEVQLSGHGKAGGQYGTTGHTSASWDEYGMFLAELYSRDSELIAGPYTCRDHFDWVTTHRYGDLTPAYAHHRHRWTDHRRVCTGTYYIHECDCGAAIRTVAPGYTWAHDIDDAHPVNARNN